MAYETGEHKVERWIAFVDIEGFASIFLQDENKGLVAIRGLMQDVYDVSDALVQGGNHRIFAHQLVDGFMLLFDIGFTNPQEVIDVCISIMRASLQRGYCLKCSITKGSAGDYTGCYPSAVRGSLSQGCVRTSKGGIMTLTTVFGPGTIAAYKNSNKEHGPLLLVDGLSHADLVNMGYGIKRGNAFELVDWINSSVSPLCSSYSTGLGVASSFQPRSSLQSYLNSYLPPPQNWTQSANDLIAGY